MFRLPFRHALQVEICQNGRRFRIRRRRFVCPETGHKTIFTTKINALISDLGSIDPTGAAGTEDARLDRHIARPRTVIVPDKLKIMIYIDFFRRITDTHNLDAPVARVMYCSSEILNASTAGANRCTFAILS
ncbi:hypothetical protein THIOKS12070026 [Thiocapsa sp. KS1]|nr:hypothetical protein [Thiocapsa sp. KS1]CRI64670.1 hypothetical protein THIOKS12070026 [Thiocapsa sp. KS1]